MRSTDVTANGRAVHDGAERAKAAEALDSRIVADLGGTRVVEDEQGGSETPVKSRPRWGRRISKRAPATLRR
jgi:hypothetical protein